MFASYKKDPEAMWISFNANFIGMKKVMKYVLNNCENRVECHGMGIKSLLRPIDRTFVGKKKDITLIHRYLNDLGIKTEVCDGDGGFDLVDIRLTPYSKCNT